MLLKLNTMNDIFSKNLLEFNPPDVPTGRGAGLIRFSTHQTSLTGRRVNTFFSTYQASLWDGQLVLCEFALILIIRTHSRHSHLRTYSRYLIIRFILLAFSISSCKYS